MKLSFCQENTQFLIGLVQCRKDERITGDVDDVMRAMPEIAHHFSTWIMTPLRARPVVPLLRRGVDWYGLQQLNPGNTTHTVRDDGLLRRELCVVGQVLEVGAAVSQAREGRIDAIRTRREYLDDGGVRHPSLVTIHPDLEHVTYGGPGDEERPASAIAKSQATRHNPLNRRFGDVARAGGEHLGDWPGRFAARWHVPVPLRL